jgi:hypothetical protein
VGGWHDEKNQLWYMNHIQQDTQHITFANLCVGGHVVLLLQVLVTSLSMQLD